ncbi:unnamed protein product [Moneuplotes crassus]|uniref:Uncharacterized protein n=1 Tax=Euplotes crassus TaxID=5936 RepID=A0AAD1U9D3_EUPCR|nr:unnamed protein product [Moneuplotes crassus]
MVKPSFPRKWNHQGNKFSQKPKTLKFIDTTKIMSPNHIDYWLPSSFEEILQEEDSSDYEFDEKKTSLDDSVKGYNPETHYADPCVRYKKLQKFMRNEQKSCRNSQSENQYKRKSECINKNLKNSVTMKNKFSGRSQNICSTKDLSLNKAKFLDSRNSRNSVSHHDRTISYNSSIDSENGIREVSLEGNLESPSHFMVNNTRVIRPQTKKKHEREVIGFIDHKYQFVLPNCDLQPKEESILSLEKLNIFKLLGKESPNEEVSRRIALNIIKEITRAEARKYRHHPLMYKFVSKILDQDTSYRI